MNIEELAQELVELQKFLASKGWTLHAGKPRAPYLVCDDAIALLRSQAEEIKRLKRELSVAEDNMQWETTRDRR